MGTLATSTTKPPSSTTRTGQPVRVKRGRGRLQADSRSRPRKVAVTRERSDRAVDFDQMYLAEMAASSVLTPEQEVKVAERIVSAERTILETFVRAPAGLLALSDLGEELDAKRLDIRDVVLNPDQAGLDLEHAAQRVRQAIASAQQDDVVGRAEAVETLANVRLDGGIVHGVIEAIRTASTTSHADAVGLVEIEAARSELKRAKERLVVGNLRLVVLFARKYLGRGVPLLDLVQEGNLGLMRAAEKFDHRRGFRFSTYAAWWIKQALQRALLDRILRLPVHVADDRRRISKLRAVFVTQQRREPTAAELSRLSGLASERVENILALPSQPTSLDAPIGEEGDATLVDLVAGSTALPDATAALHALGGHIETLMAGLTPREQQVLRMRFGMGGAHEHTLEEVGRALSLTRERIRQIERGALDKLRVKSDRVELHSYLDA